MNNLLLDPWFDMEGRRNELGLTPASKKTTPTPTTPTDPTSTQPEPRTQESVVYQAEQVISQEVKTFPAVGTMEFNKVTYSEQTTSELFSELRNFMPQVESQTNNHQAGLELTPKRHDVLDNLPTEKISVTGEVQKTSAVLGSYALDMGEKTLKTTKHELKDTFKALKSLFMDFIAFKHLTKEQKEAKAKKEQAAKAKAQVKKGFFGRLKEAASVLIQEKMRKSMEEQDRLGVGGISTDEKNRILGATRNRSNQDINSTYHNQETFFAMQREREQKKKEEDQASLQAKGKSGPLDLNKIAEGGSILSTTGGVGAG